MTGAGSGQGSVPVALGLALEDGEVVGGVVRHDRQAAGRGIRQRGDDLGDRRRPPALPFEPSTFGGDAVDERRGGGDLDARIDEPLASLEHLAVGADHADVGGHDAARVDVDAGGLEVEDGEGVGPAGAARGIHGGRLWAATVTTGSSGSRVRGIRCGDATGAQAPRRRMSGMIASPYAEQLARIPVSAHRVDVDGTETAWWEYGAADAPVLVLVHGFRGDHHGLEPVVAQLPGFRIISPDLPGFGESATFPSRPHDIDAYADWLAAFIDARRHRRVPTRCSATRSARSWPSAAVARGLAPERLVLVNPIGAPALEGPRGVMTRLAVLYYRTAAALPERAGFALLRNGAIVRVMSVTMAKTRRSRCGAGSTTSTTATSRRSATATPCSRRSAPR